MRGGNCTTFDQLRRKEVISVTDGRRLGNVVDIGLDTVQGRILNLVVPGSTKIWQMMKNDRDWVIPWDHIVKIGDDVVLVRLDQACFPVDERRADRV